MWLRDSCEENLAVICTERNQHFKIHHQPASTSPTLATRSTASSSTNFQLLTNVLIWSSSTSKLPTLTTTSLSSSNGPLFETRWTTLLSQLLKKSPPEISSEHSFNKGVLHYKDLSWQVYRLERYYWRHRKIRIDFMRANLYVKCLKT